jgi:hypothetical protein
MIIDTEASRVRLLLSLIDMPIDALIKEREKLIEQEGEQGEDHDTALMCRLLVDTIDCIGRLRFGRYYFDDVVEKAAAV